MGQVVYLRAYRSEYQSPISALSITPLIDVMLVLIVMLILALPATVHQVPVDLPTPGESDGRDPVIQKLVLTNDGVAHWNGTAMTDAALGDALRGAARTKDQLQFQTEGGVRYERFDQMIAMVKSAGVNKIGFVGNQAFASWSK